MVHGNALEGNLTSIPFCFSVPLVLREFEQSSHSNPSSGFQGHLSPREAAEAQLRGYLPSLQWLHCTQALGPFRPHNPQKAPGPAVQLA